MTDHADLIARARGFVHKLDADALIHELADALEALPADTGWETVVLGRERAGEGDWTVTTWEPSEIEFAREHFPGSRYRLGKIQISVEGDEA